MRHVTCLTEVPANSASIEQCSRHSQLSQSVTTTPSLNRFFVMQEAHRAISGLWYCIHTSGLMRNSMQAPQNYDELESWRLRSGVID